MDLGVVVFEPVDGVAGVAVSLQQVADIGDDRLLFHFEVPLQFRAVIREETLDDLLLRIGARLRQLPERGGQVGQGAVDVVVVGLVEIAQDVAYAAAAQHLGVGPEIGCGVNLAEQQEGVGIDVGGFADLLHAVVAEALVDAETGKQAEQVEILFHQVGHFHLPAEFHRAFT